MAPFQEARILINHVGFMPAETKCFVVINPPTEDFQVIRRSDGNVVYTGRLREVSEDLGAGWVGSFSDLSEEGTYTVRCGDVYSYTVTVYSGVYNFPLRTIFNYFPTQRCGDSTTGWHAPCHAADARRVDTGEHVDVSGGWHQSCDLRKWMGGNAWGVLGLSQFRLTASPRWDGGRIADELRWGNRYLHNMVRPDGGLMDHVVLPHGWVEERDLYPNDAPPSATFTNIAGQATAARLFRERDPDYSRTCLEVARRMWRYITGPDYPGTPYEPPVIPEYHEFMSSIYTHNYRGSAQHLGGKLYAALAIFKATGEAEWLDAACRTASALVDLQVGGDVSKDPVAACFRVGPGRSDLTRDCALAPAGLCELVEAAPRHKDAGKWRAAVRLIAEQKCTMAGRNPWGLIPSFWCAEDPGGRRKAGSGFYRYFSVVESFRVGVNATAIGNALFLLRAASITNDSRCREIACRQLDWILGCNPFNASTVEGVGRNQPERLISLKELFPPTPQIPGAVMTGIVGTDDDEPLMVEGGINAEYDMPPTAMLMWLMAELGA